jgi:hypothetical protein
MFQWKRRAAMIVEDYEAIGRRAAALKLRCALRQGRPIGECWCYGAAPNGAHLPCPERYCPDAPISGAGDPFAEIRARIDKLFGPPFYAR